MIRFKTEEAALIVDALNGIARGEGIGYVNHLYHNVMDSVAIDELDKKWGVDRSDLRMRLAVLSDADAKDVLERVYSFWAAGPHTHLETALGEANLLEAVA